MATQFPKIRVIRGQTPDPDFNARMFYGTIENVEKR
jgi:hypothetical protein